VTVLNRLAAMSHGQGVKGAGGRVLAVSLHESGVTQLNSTQDIGQVNLTHATQEGTSITAKA